MPTAAAKLLQSCLTLCDPKDSSPPGTPVPGILQARTVEWVAISFSSAWKWKVKVKSLSRVQLSATPWTAAYQAPPSMWFSRQEYWSGVPFTSKLKGISKNNNNNNKFFKPKIREVSDLWYTFVFSTTNANSNRHIVLASQMPQAMVPLVTFF